MSCKLNYTRTGPLACCPPQNHLVLLKSTAMAEPTIHNLEIDGGPDPSVQEFIDNTLAALVNELSRSPAEANISITLKRRASPIACIINPTTGALEASPRIDTYRKYSWPGKTAYEAWKFSKILPPPTVRTPTGHPSWITTDRVWVF